MSRLILLALVSNLTESLTTGATDESTLICVESVVDSVFDAESLQAAKIDARANTTNPFFIVWVLIYYLFAFYTILNKR